MPYLTISIKLLSPTKKKREVLDTAIENYSIAFSRLQQSLRGITPKKPANKVSWMTLLNRERMENVGDIPIIPFKDSLKMDIGIELAHWYKQSSKYPISRTDDEDIDAALHSTHTPTQRQIDKLYDKYRKARPIFFCRYDLMRNYSLWKDSFSGRYYAKLYLFDRKNASIADSFSDQQWLVPLFDRKKTPKTPIDEKKRRFLFFPLQLGERQRQQLSLIETGKAEPKSAQLTKQAGKYYLHVRAFFPAIESKSTENYLGVCRGTGHRPLYYCVCAPDGEILFESTGKEVSTTNADEKSHIWANEIVALAESYRCQVLFSKVAPSKKMLSAPESHVLGYHEYQQLFHRVTYKCAFAALPKPILVLGARIYFRCTMCGSALRANRYDQQQLLCVRCGYFSDTSKIAAQNLAKTLIRYRQNKILVNYFVHDQQITFRLAELDIEFSCTYASDAVDHFCDYLKNRLEENHLSAAISAKKRKKQSSIRKKLLENQFLQDALQFCKIEEG